MKQLGGQCLYAQDPLWQQFIGFLWDVVDAVVAFYWDVMKLWGGLMMGLMAIAFIAGGASDLRNGAEHWYLSVPCVAFGVALFVSREVRLFFWASLGLFILWLGPVSVFIYQLLGPGQPVQSWQARVCIGLLYFAPPLFGAAFFHQRRRMRAAEQPPGRRLPRSAPH